MDTKKVVLILVALVAVGLGAYFIGKGSSQDTDQLSASVYSATKGTADPITKKVITVGVKNVNISDIQDFLRSSGYLASTEKSTGTYDTKTSNAVRAFQKASGLTETGTLELKASGKDSASLIANPNEVDPGGIPFRRWCWLTGGTYSHYWQNGHHYRVCSYDDGLL